MKSFAIVALIALPAMCLHAQGTAPSDALPAGPEADAPPVAIAVDGSLSRVMDSFISAFAGVTPDWRTDVKVGGPAETDQPPSGYQVGKSEMGLRFFFRPKTSDMLTLDERRAIIRDPRFSQYLATMRQVADGNAPRLDPAIAAAAKAPPIPSEPVAMGRAELMSRLLAGRRPPPDTVYFDVSAEELVLPGRLLLTLDPTDAP